MKTLRRTRNPARGPQFNSSEMLVPLFQVDITFKYSIWNNKNEEPGSNWIIQWKIKGNINRYTFIKFFTTWILSVNHKNIIKKCFNHRHCKIISWQQIFTYKIKRRKRRIRVGSNALNNSKHELPEKQESCRRTDSLHCKSLA